MKLLKKLGGSAVSSKRSILISIAATVCTVAGLLLLPDAARPSGSVRNGATLTSIAEPAQRAARGAYTPSYSARTGRELVMVFIGASFCGAHRQTGFPEAIEQAKLELRSDAQSTGRGFRAVGVSLDWEPDSALIFLRRFGRWDELSVGGNWVSEAALRYIWGDLPGPATVPQVLVIERQLENGAAAVVVTGERLVRRLVGTDAIAAWVTAGAPAGSVEMGTLLESARGETAEGGAVLAASAGP